MLGIPGKSWDSGFPENSDLCQMLRLVADFVAETGVLWKKMSPVRIPVADHLIGRNSVVRSPLLYSGMNGLSMALIAQCCRMYTPSSCTLP